MLHASLFMKKEIKSEVYQIRLSKTQRKTWAKAAKRYGLRLGPWMHMNLDRVAYVQTHFTGEIKA